MEELLIQLITDATKNKVKIWNYLSQIQMICNNIHSVSRVSIVYVSQVLKWFIHWFANIILETSQGNN